MVHSVFHPGFLRRNSANSNAQLSHLRRPDRYLRGLPPVSKSLHIITIVRIYMSLSIRYPRYYDCVRLDAIPCWLWEALYAQRDDDHCISHLPIDSPSMGSSAAAGIASARFMVSAVALVALIL